jgi:hypothetical protein
VNEGVCEELNVLLHAFTPPRICLYVKKDLHPSCSLLLFTSVSRNVLVEFGCLSSCERALVLCCSYSAYAHISTCGGEGRRSRPVSLHTPST